jgi:hypothetical protein
MTSLSVQDLLAIRLCSVGGCPEEVENGSDKCRRHDRAPVGLDGWGQSRPRDERPRREKLEMPKVDHPTMSTEMHDEFVQQFEAFRDAHGRWPLPSDTRDYPGKLPTRDRVDVHLGQGGWQALWDELGAGKVPTGRAAQKYRNGIFAGPVLPLPAPPVELETDEELAEEVEPADVGLEEEARLNLEEEQDLAALNEAPTEYSGLHGRPVEYLGRGHFAEAPTVEELCAAEGLEYLGSGFVTEDPSMASLVRQFEIYAQRFDDARRDLIGLYRAIVEHPTFARYFQVDLEEALRTPDADLDPPDELG